MRLIICRNPELNNCVYVYVPLSEAMKELGVNKPSNNISYIKRDKNGNLQYDMSSHEWIEHILRTARNELKSFLN